MTYTDPSTVFLDALLKKGVAFGDAFDASSFFTNLKLEVPQHPDVALRSLFERGQVEMQPENDDLNADPRRPAKKTCMAIRPSAPASSTRRSTEPA